MRSIGNVGPQFQWNLLNYGRIRNNVLYQDALLKDLMVGYQATVLQASQDVENGIVTFLHSQVQARLLQRERATRTSRPSKSPSTSTKTGPSISHRYATIEQTLVTQQELYAQAQGQIAQGLVQVYRAMGGGWEIRCPAPPAAAAESLRGPPRASHAADAAAGAAPRDEPDAVDADGAAPRDDPHALAAAGDAVGRRGIRDWREGHVAALRARTPLAVSQCLGAGDQ